MALRCTVATPTRELFQGVIAYASIPGADGSYGVLPGHELFVGTNDKGILSLWLDSEGKERREFVIFKGASQVFNDRVSVLGSFGIALEEIDVAAVRAEAEELRQKAEALAKDEDEQSKIELETTQTRLEWCDIQLNVAEGSAK